jgi:hypothetical protein
MKSFPEFESTFLGVLQQERADLQGLQDAPEAQLSPWIEHLFRASLGSSHWKEIDRQGSAEADAQELRGMAKQGRMNHRGRVSPARFPGGLKAVTVRVA